MTSVVIAAHNEAPVIGRCLDALLADAAPGELDITVVANGCTDDTALLAAQRRVRVIELGEAGKSAALNAGDRHAIGYPRIYLDADIVLPTAAARALAAAVGGQALAAVPRRELDLRGRPFLVRGFYAINSRLPMYRDGLFGRGAIALSAAGRSRFTEFPEVAADDLYLDSLFAPAEKAEVAAVTSIVATPRRTGDLVRRLTRVRRGNAVLRTSGQQIRRADRGAWLREVVLPRPWLAPAAVCYVGITLLAALAARRGQDTWGHDASSRQEQHV
jgi:glycosyltransferase involved in cell wall biosynthesis